MSDLPTRHRLYVTGVCDSSRWDGFEFREGDIVVCTAPKCGTTWTQMLCALLVHGERLPRPLNKLSRWMDRYALPIEELRADLEAQPWRRIIKTHTPLDGLPYDARVKYVVCGRDPRDAFLSFLDHMRNASEQTALDVKRRAGLPDDMELPSDPNVIFPLWITTGMQEWTSDGAPFGLPLLYFYETFWAFRDLPNIHFTHYADLRKDLAGEMKRLAAFLGGGISEADIDALTTAASFDAMRAGADQAAPGAEWGEWRSNTDFFRAARLESWREILSQENQSLYETASAKLDPALKAWLDNGGLRQASALS
jgi:aryl sulfotransferase